MTKITAKTIIVLGCMVKPPVAAGGLAGIPGCTERAWGGLFCLWVTEGGETVFTAGGVLVDG